MSAIQSQITTWFSKEDYSSIESIQFHLREIDMALYERVKKDIGEKQTFVYSYLAGCCSLLDTSDESMSEQTRNFIKNVVDPIVKECFEAIDASKKNLNDQKLKDKLQELLSKIQFFPKKNEFEIIKDEKVLAVLKEKNLLTFTGQYAFYKLQPGNKEFYAGWLEIDAKIGDEIAEILEQHGYKDKNDVLGSALLSSANDKKWHISTIDARELSRNHDQIIARHNDFAAKEKASEISIIGIKQGRPQLGRLGHMVAVVVKVNNLKEYRKACGLPENQAFGPHLSLFSREVNPAPTLKGRSILELANGSPSHLQNLASYFKTFIAQ